MPNAKLKDRQKTCGAPQCQREWHRKKCEEWNRNNLDYFRANYLQNKLTAASQPARAFKATQPGSRVQSSTRHHLKVRLPLDVVQEVISVQQVVIIEYFGHLLFRRFQEVLRGQVVVNTREVSQLPPVAILRGDRLGEAFRGIPAS
jgi:hypothetical protein